MGEMTTRKKAEGGETPNKKKLKAQEREQCGDFRWAIQATYDPSVKESRRCELTMVRDIASISFPGENT